MGSTPTELLWGIVNTVLVLLLQAGFICHEIGFGNSKNAQIVKQLFGLIVSALLFGIVGYRLMLADEGVTLTRIVADPLFLFQLMLCVTVATVIASTAANQLTVNAHLLMVALASGVVYPLLSQWMQGDVGWLVIRGFTDFSNATVVFGAGGAALLAIVWIVGHPEIPASEEIGMDGPGAFGALGILLLTIGWIGLTGGNAAPADAVVGQLTSNVLAAGAIGLLLGGVFSWWQHRALRVPTIATSVLTSLVAVAAGAHLYTPLTAVATGAIASVFVHLSLQMLHRRYFNPTLAAVPTYLVASVWGALAVALFAPAEALTVGRGQQMVVQLLGAAVVLVGTLGVYAPLLYVLKRFAPRFVSENMIYAVGVQDAVDAHQTYTDLMAVLERQSQTGDLTLRAPEEPFSEFGRIAQSYNRVIDRLAQNKQQSETILRSSMDGIVTIRQHDLMVLDMNPAAETIFGQQTDNLREVPIGALIDLKSLDDARSILQEALRTGHSFQFSAINFAGEQFPIEAVVSDAKLDNEDVYIATFRDITERYQAQAKLQELNDKLVEASRHQEAFVAAISHELRTPLNAILGMSQALAANVYGELGTRQRGATEKITESGRHLLELIDDILDLSKINSDEQVVEKHPLPVSYICTAALSMVQPQADEKGIRIRTKYDPDVVTVEADARRLKQILINLLNNAVKFTPSGGRVGLMVVGAPSTNEVHFIVWDNGIGIPAERQKDLFQPFVQLDNSPARQYGGVGLGLALVKQLVKLHNGSVSVLSEEGKGSRFVVTLPWPSYIQAQQQSQVAANNIAIELPPLEFVEPRRRTERPKKLTKQKILLADNNEATLTTLKDYLTMHGYEVLVARDGIEAVTMTAVDFPDLVLLDLQIREVDGFDALQQMRDEHAPDTLPIIVLTSNTQVGLREQCIEAGASVFMNKPVGPARLAHTIKRQLSEVQAVLERIPA